MKLRKRMHLWVAFSSLMLFIIAFKAVAYEQRCHLHPLLLILCSVSGLFAFSLLTKLQVTTVVATGSASPVRLLRQTLTSQYVAISLVMSFDAEWRPDI